MKFIKRSTRPSPKVSLILVDWTVRESFHLLHYLSKQDVPRDVFEVIIIEYYSRVSDAIRPFEDQVDTWVLLETPKSNEYHKHLMYNAGLVLSRGEICVICDSDAMVRESFTRAIISEFDRDPNIVLHFDQFRNLRRDFYPFNYPRFEDVLGAGCINNVAGKTKGLIDTVDPIHTRNYGACMCARREDMIAIGGADEHIDYLGHICGPYDMTFRLVNLGLREVWHSTEFLYHTWHPGQAGVGNYLGPHDGRHVSTTALDALASRRVMPLVENRAIAALREGASLQNESLLELLSPPEHEQLQDHPAQQAWSTSSVTPLGRYKGFALYKEHDIVFAHLLLDEHQGRTDPMRYRIFFEGPSESAVRTRIVEWTPRSVALYVKIGQWFITGWQAAKYAFRLLSKSSLQLVARTR